MRGRPVAASTGAWPIWPLAAVLPVALSGAVRLLPASYFGQGITAAWIISLAAALVLVWPSRFAALAGTAASAGLWLLLRKVNADKIAFTDFPLTALDIRMFALNPSGALRAIGVSEMAQSGLWIGIAVAALALAGLALRRLGASFGPGMTRTTLWAAMRAVFAVAALALLFQQSERATAAFVRNHGQTLRLWEGNGLANFARDIGIIPFLIYSQYIEADGAGNFLTYRPRAEPPSADELNAAATKLLKVSEFKARPLPDVFIVHAESTFDPNEAFHLKAPIANDLFYTQAASGDPALLHFRGPALANVIGGMSWVSEFEVITGLDSRLFGVAGRYTHAALSHLVRKSLPRYFAEKGYATYSFTADDSAFYNYETAYRRYGFNFIFPRTGDPHDDLSIMRQSIARLSIGSSVPVFAFIALYENHSPHDCDSSHASDLGDADFAGDPTPEQTCGLREYARRARHTEQAVAMLRQAAEQRGKPFVIAIYGDHQPYSFTGGDSAEQSGALGVDRFRTGPDRRRVSMEIISSAANPLRCCGGGAVPLTLLPTLVSAYVADSVSGLYLPQNLDTFDRCGSDFIGELTGASFYGDRGHAFRSACKDFDRVVAGLQQSGVMGDGRDPPATATCGPHSIGLDLSGMTFKGEPEFEVRANAEKIGSGTASARQSYRFTVPPGEKLNHVDVAFANDYWEGDGKDRNLVIHRLAVDGVDLANERVIFSASAIGRQQADGSVLMMSNGRAIWQVPGDLSCPPP